MQETTIFFQNNLHPRDYIIEVSNAYLIARSIHVVINMQLMQKIPFHGISFEELTALYPNYDSNALSTLVNTISAYQILDIKQGKIYYTPLSEIFISESTAMEVSSKEWCDTYDVIEYLQNEKSVVPFDDNTKIVLSENNLILHSCSKKNILFELSRLHLISRAISYAAELNLFRYLSQSNKSTLTIAELQKKCLKNNIEQFAIGFKNMLLLLARYHLINFHVENDQVSSAQFGHYLIQDLAESLHPALIMIDEKWWRAAAYFEESLKKCSLSAYEFANKKDFYQAQEERPHLFSAGMSALSFFDNKRVAETLKQELQPFSTIVDIGGGEGNLLQELVDSFGSSKRYILFEKVSSIANDATNTKNLYVKDKTRYAFETILGNFFHNPPINGIPQYDDAAYCIKCVLHNLDEKQATIVIKNVRLAMGKKCRLFLAERIIPLDDKKPHINKIGSLMMLMLFKVNAHDHNFYQEILNQTGFIIDKTTTVMDYTTFSTSMKQ